MMPSSSALKNAGYIYCIGYTSKLFEPGAFENILQGAIWNFFFAVPTDGKLFSRYGAAGYVAATTVSDAGAAFFFRSFSSSAVVISSPHKSMIYIYLYIFYS